MAGWCLCGHYIDGHDFDGICAVEGCDCEEFSPSELLSAQEAPQGEE